MSTNNGKRSTQLLGWTGVEWQEVKVNSLGQLEVAGIATNSTVIKLEDGTVAGQYLAIDVNGLIGINNFPASFSVSNFPATYALPTAQLEAVTISRFQRVLKMEPTDDDIRFIREKTTSYDYHGAYYGVETVDATQKADANWDIVRFDKTVTGTLDVRIRTGLTWNGRATGW